MTVPLVSIVVPFLDAELFLGEAIESVRNQTIGDWELLLVDDGSSDASTDIARGVAAADPRRVRYLHHPGHANLGVSATRNRGINEARGRYLALLDADDVWVPEKLEEQVAILEAHPEVGLLFGASLYWWSWRDDREATADTVKHPGATPDRRYDPPELMLSLYPLGKGIAPCPSSCIARRSVVEGFGGFADEFRTMYEDQVFLTRAYLSTPVWISSRCWDRYRCHPASITQRTGEVEYHVFRRTFLEWLGGHLNDQGIDEPHIRAAMKRAWLPYDHPRLARLRHHAGVARARLQRRLRSRRSD